jgi:hypothetical protein
MSRQVDEELQEMAAEVRGLEVLPAAAVRARGHRRSRRQLAALTVAGAVVATTAGVTVGWSRQHPAPPTGTAAAAPPAVDCVLALPDSPAAVRVRVLDGGAPTGLPATTVSQLRARTFTVLAGTTGPRVAGAADLRYGPASIGAATVLRAVIRGEVTMRFDPDRRDDVIDLTMGPAFTRLGTATEVNQSLAAGGEPAAPPQCR